jgi:parallel beta-helix repeat protein
MKKLFLFITVVAVAGSLFGSTTIYVKWDASGANSGTNWTDAFTSFQSALNAAVSGDQIWVAKGTYKPSYDYGLGGGSRNYHFRMIDGVAIYGGFAGTETQLNQRDWNTNVTILSGDLNGDDVITGSGQTLSITNTSDNCYCVFYHPNGLGLTSSAVLDGFKITGGSYSTLNGFGGGIYNNASSPSITNCIVSGNSNGGSGNSYGGIYITGTCSPIIYNCIISQNQGGGILITNGLAGPTIFNCTISGNKAGVGGVGGGVCNTWTFNSGTTLTNCLITGNYSPYLGGGIYVYKSEPTLTNCTISANLAYQGGGFFDYYADGTTLDNVIIWGNTATSDGNQIGIVGVPLTLNYSCYQNGQGDLYISGGTLIATNNDITLDPVFANASTGDFRIQGTSPCLDVGNDTYNNLTTDIRGAGFGRKLLKTDRTKVGTIDMGAYEFQAGIDPPLTPCIPTLSQWGLIIMGIVLVLVGTFYIIRRTT